ncbi:MAG: SpoIVB peptidase [Lachnospiraceae bacterium]|nr:SpoIVB peptidase [Ruminococcus sp.]MCM1273948.1 SpoIVB peptidase [Lachnospiraceae bacterium]
MIASPSGAFRAALNYKRKAVNIMMRKQFKIFSGTAAALTALFIAVFGYFYAALPCDISVDTGAGFSGGGFSPVVLRQTAEGVSYYLGELPIKTAEVAEKPRRSVIPCGTPFGIKVRSDGVMVIEVAEDSPADKAGIKAGDVIVSVNGEEVRTNSELSEAVQLSPEGTDIVLRRNGGEASVNLVPEDGGGFLKIGAWVRDSAAGIGTLTFLDPETMMFGGLGHAVSDVTTGGAVPLKSGEITEAEIYDVVKGKEGSAGELCGAILPNSDIGELSGNTPAGVFGRLSAPVEGKTVPVAFRQEVSAGKAVMLTTVDSGAPREYSIEIERINLLDLNGSKGMVIRITDSGLLEKTGGIVRGMSGSPILQNGMLVGAVTHVLVSDPTRGYAVFAESMLDNCKNLTAMSIID